MQKLHYSIHINAPREKVWDTMLADATYRQWTSAFGEGGYYKGDWSEGSKILFLGIDPESGKEMGMVSRIAENRPPCIRFHRASGHRRWRRGGHHKRGSP